MAAGRLDDAVSCFEAALAAKPGYPQARWIRALAWLAAGDYERGWSEYEWRLKTEPHLIRHFARPRWEGTCGIGVSPMTDREHGDSHAKGPVHGRDGRATILLYSEQGLGDTIRFIRFTPMLAQIGAGVVVQCQPMLTRLLRSVDGIDALDSTEPQTTEYYLHAPLSSLPGLLGCCYETVPNTVPYIHPEPYLEAMCKEKLAEVSGLKVGLNW